MQPNDYYSSKDYKEEARRLGRWIPSDAYKTYGPKLDEKNTIHNYSPLNPEKNVHPYFRKKLEPLFTKIMDEHGKPPFVVGTQDYTGTITLLIIAIVFLILALVIPQFIETKSYRIWVQAGMWIMFAYAGVFTITSLFNTECLYDEFLRIFHEYHMLHQRDNKVKDYDGFIDNMGSYLRKVDECSDKFAEQLK